MYLPRIACRTLDPDWGEEFYLEWSEVAAGKRHVLVEVWDWDFWRPDELLGRGFIDINALSFEPQEVGA
jgi:Ca2+-dependent lipid-binding protein